MPNSPKDASGPQAQPTVEGKPQGPQALPALVSCDVAVLPHKPNGDCINPRPAHPPAARQGQDLVGGSDGQAVPVDAPEAAGHHEHRPCKPDDAGVVARTTVQLDPVWGCVPQAPFTGYAPVSAAPVEPARAQMLVVCAANWDTPHVLNSHHLSESHYCINPKDAPHAPSATPEPEKLGEVKREAQWRKRCKAVCGIARDLQFKEMADSMRLGALTSVMTPAELADFNARIKANTKDIRQRLAAMRAAPTTKVGED